MRMMKLERSLMAGTFASLALALCTGTGAAQINSTPATVSLTATLAETLTISATPSAVSFTLSQGGSANASAPVVITSNWLLSSGRGSVKLYGYFTAPTAALTDGATTPNNIPTSEVFGAVTSGGTTSTATAFTGNGAFGGSGASLLLYNQAVSAANRYVSGRTDSLALSINLSGQAQLPAGSYAGTLNLQAQAL